VNPEEAVALVLPRSGDFLGSTEVFGCTNSHAYPSRRVEVTGPVVFEELLTDLAEQLAGMDWVDEDDDFIEECDAAGIDYERLIGVEGPLTPNQADDLERKEIGDLGELIGLLFLLAYDDADPVQVLPKNTLKLYERISEPGIDILAFSLDLSLSASDPLQQTEVMTILESKASGSDSFVTLGTQSAASLKGVGLVRLQRELRLARASYRTRGEPEAAKRLKRFLVEFHRRGQLAANYAFLTGNQPVTEPYACDALGELSDLRPLSATLFRADIGGLRVSVYSFRGSSGNE
jgi:hypothetical protein